MYHTRPSGQQQPIYASAPSGKGWSSAQPYEQFKNGDTPKKTVLPQVVQRRLSTYANIPIDIRLQQQKVLEYWNNQKKIQMQKEDEKLAIRLEEEQNREIQNRRNEEKKIKM
jgi:arginine/lysine/ornithine decarboxylase